MPPTFPNFPLKRFCLVCIFAIALAYIESAVVVYLRTIFYPDGFTFPLPGFAEGSLWQKLLFIEIGREAATLVILITSCRLLATDTPRRIAWFLTIFAVWDIFYYLWLKLFIDWPASVMDWDVLFLIPAVWASPVIAPIIVSLTMLLLATIILHRAEIGRTAKPRATHLAGLLAGPTIIVIAFCLAGRHIQDPDYAAYFSWTLFALGEALAIAAFFTAPVKSARTPESRPADPQPASRA